MFGLRPDLGMMAFLGMVGAVCVLEVVSTTSWNNLRWALKLCWRSDSSNVGAPPSSMEIVPALSPGVLLLLFDINTTMSTMPITDNNAACIQPLETVPAFSPTYR